MSPSAHPSLDRLSSRSSSWPPTLAHGHKLRLRESTVQPTDGSASVYPLPLMSRPQTVLERAFPVSSILSPVVRSEPDLALRFACDSAHDASLIAAFSSPNDSLYPALLVA